MAKLRIARNMENSIIEHLKDHLAIAQWDDVIVEKSFNRIYGLQMNENTKQAAICVRASDTNRKRLEIGSDAMIRSQLVMLDVFATSDGQRLDLVDFLGSLLISGVPFYKYNIFNGVVMERVQYGIIRILTIEDKPVQFGVDKSSLDVQDRYRHLITLNCSLSHPEMPYCTGE